MKYCLHQMGVIFHAEIMEISTRLDFALVEAKSNQV